MDRWQSLIDQQIQQMQQAGELDNLPGTGKPLHLNDDPNTPDDMRLAYKILRQNDLAPDWIMQARELDTLRAQLVDKLNQAAKVHRTAPTITGDLWNRTQRGFREGAQKYNKQILTYNLKIPVGVAPKLPLEIEREIQRALTG